MGTRRILDHAARLLDGGLDPIEAIKQAGRQGRKGRKQMRTALTSGKTGPAFTAKPDPTPSHVEHALDDAAAYGLTRNDFARLALLCLDEAATREGVQAQTVRLIRRLMIDSGLYSPKAGATAGEKI